MSTKVRKRVYVDYYGKQVTLDQVAKRQGIPYQCIYSRYDRRERGPELWRPSNASKLPAEPVAMAIPDQKISVVDGEMMRSKAAARERRHQSKSEQHRTAKAAMRAAHAEEFRRPLIDQALLSTAERNEIRGNVIYSGQRMWSIKGGG